jgi:hypothetical protein
VATIFELYSEFHRKKWFPDKYPDPLAELADYLDESAIHDLVQRSKTEKNRGLLQIAFELTKLLPSRKFPDLYRDYIQAYRESLTPPNCHPEFSYFHLRRLPNDQRSELWSNLNDWAKRNQSRMFDWHHARISVENTFEDLRKELANVYGFDKEREIQKIASRLTSTRENFELQFSSTKSFHEAIASFRMSEWDETFNWNDFAGLARSFLNNCSIRKQPSLTKSSIDDAVQFCYPIFPPEKVIVEYGAAAGPADTLRFIKELVKGCFHTNMNPELRAEFRFNGDESLVQFWSALYTLPLTRKAGIETIVGPAAQNLTLHMESFLQFWQRYDSFLAAYRYSAENNFENAEDHFAENWRNSFHFDVPGSLFLYELDRAAGASSRVAAFDAALLAEEQLRTQYGNLWFTSNQWAARLQSYWWEGFSLSLADVLKDLNIKFVS